MIELRVLSLPEPPAASVLAQVKALAVSFPGKHELMVIVPLLTCARCGSSEGECRCPGVWEPKLYRLKLGIWWRYDASPGCMAALSEFGVVHVR